MKHVGRRDILREERLNGFALSIPDESARILPTQPKSSVEQ
jgi:hypothetical protein